MNYAAGVKTSRMQVVRDAIDAGAGPGYVEIGTAGMSTVLARIDLADPASSVAGAVLSLAGLPKSGASLAAGTPAVARIRDSNGNDVATDLVVGTDLTLSPSVINGVGQTVTITAGTITHA